MLASSEGLNNSRIRDRCGWFRDNLLALASLYLSETCPEVYEKIPPEDPAADFGAFCELVRQAAGSQLGLTLPPPAR